MSEQFTPFSAAAAAHDQALNPLSAQYASAVHSRTSALVGTLQQLSAGRDGDVEPAFLKELKEILARSERQSALAQQHATDNQAGKPNSRAATEAREMEAAAAREVLALNDAVQQGLVHVLLAEAQGNRQGQVMRDGAVPADGRSIRIDGLADLTQAVSRVGNRQPPPLDENQQRINRQMEQRRRNGAAGGQPDRDGQAAQVKLVADLIGSP